MKIIDFLMDHIYYVVIAFGILASLFSKSGGKKKPSQMPDFGGGGLPRSLQPESSEETQRPSPPVLQEQPERQTVYRSRSEQESEQSMQSSYDGLQVEMPTRASQTASFERMQQKAAVSRGRTQDAAERQSGAQGAVVTSVRGEDLRKAVIWAEVLGPPRAKKPYRR